MTAAIAPELSPQRASDTSPTARASHGRAAACRRRRPGRWRCATCSRRRGALTSVRGGRGTRSGSLEADRRGPGRRRARSGMRRAVSHARHRDRGRARVARRVEGPDGDGVHAVGRRPPSGEGGRVRGAACPGTRALRRTRTRPGSRRGCRWRWRPCSGVEVNVAPAVGAVSVTVGASASEPEPDPPEPDPPPVGFPEPPPGGRSTSSLALAGDASTLPAASVARTSTVCWARPRPV